MPFPETLDPFGAFCLRGAGLLLGALGESRRGIPGLLSVRGQGGKGGKEQGGSSAVQDHLFAFPSFFAGAWREPSGGQYFRRASRARGFPCSSASSR